jgi:transporter family-2 protein
VSSANLVGSEAAGFCCYRFSGAQLLLDAQSPGKAANLGGVGGNGLIKSLIPAALALAAGMSVVVQQILNANLRSELNSAVWSGFTSYLVGVLCMIAMAVVLREPIPSVGVMARIPWWAWSGGLFGAIFIGISILVAHQLGAVALIALLVSGQMAASIALDHFGWLGLAQRPLDLTRLIGVCLLIGGVVLIRR